MKTAITAQLRIPSKLQHSKEKGKGSTGRKQESQHNSEYQASSNTRRKKGKGALDENSNHSTTQNTKQAPTLERKRERGHWTKTAITTQQQQQQTNKQQTTATATTPTTTAAFLTQDTKKHLLDGTQLS